MTEVIKIWRNSKQKVFATLTDDGILHKTERQKDRLRMFSLQAHAIDLALLLDAQQSGATQVRLKELLNDGGVCFRRWEISDLLEQEPIEIKGNKRIPLKFNLSLAPQKKDSQQRLF